MLSDIRRGAFVLSADFVYLNGFYARAIVLILLFLFGVCGFLGAENSGQFLSQRLVEYLHEIDFDDKSNLYIDFQAMETSDLNKMILQEHLLKNGFSLVETEQFADYFVTIRVEESFIVKRTERFPKVNELFKEMTFLVQFTRKNDAMVLSIKRYVFEEKHQQENVIQNKWFTPYLIALVLGSLVYYIFYGN